MWSTLFLVVLITLVTKGEGQNCVDAAGFNFKSEYNNTHKWTDSVCNIRFVGTLTADRRNTCYDLVWKD